MIATASPEDIRYVIGRMRADDLREVMSASGCTNDAQFLDACLALHGPRFAAVYKGAPVAVCGVAFQPGNPIPALHAWLFGTNDIGKCGVEIMHLAKRIAKLMFLRGHQRIEAYSATFHKDAHGWLKGIGFREERIIEGYGSDGQDFIVFAMTKGD